MLNEYDFMPPVSVIRRDLDETYGNTNTARAKHLHSLGYAKVFWQPIESAPKDGSVILVYDPDELFPFAATWNGECDVWVDALGDNMVEPTRWMPLPTPPNL